MVVVETLAVLVPVGGLTMTDEPGLVVWCGRFRFAKRWLCVVVCRGVV